MVPQKEETSQVGDRKKEGRFNTEDTESTEFAEKRRTSLRTGQRASLWGLGGFGWVELHGTDDALAFFDEDHLVGLDVGGSRRGRWASGFPGARRSRLCRCRNGRANHSAKSSRRRCALRQSADGDFFRP